MFNVHSVLYQFQILSNSRSPRRFEFLLSLSTKRKYSKHKNVRWLMIPLKYNLKYGNAMWMTAFLSSKGMLSTPFMLHIIPSTLTSHSLLRRNLTNRSLSLILWFPTRITRSLLVYIIAKIPTRTDTQTFLLTLTNATRLAQLRLSPCN